jgi:hypothetical protein
MKVSVLARVLGAALILSICPQSKVMADATSSSTSDSASKSQAAQQQGLVNAPSTTYNTPGDVTYRGGYSVYVPPQVAAPALTTTLSDTCMGSWSAGISVPGGGATFGKTQVDEDCVARLHARQLVAMNAEPLAMEVLCSRQVILDADARMQTPICAANIKKRKQAELTAPEASTHIAQTQDGCYKDKIVARRMNVPPCD